MAGLGYIHYIWTTIHGLEGVAEGNNYVRRKKGGRRKVGREAETLKIG